MPPHRSNLEILTPKYVPELEQPTQLGPRLGPNNWHRTEV